MDAGDVVTSVIAGLALVVSILAWWSSHKSANASETSAEAAVRSATSSETSATAAVRSADAAEKSANAEHEQWQLALEDRKAQMDEVRRRPWSMERVTHRKFKATFNGEQAFGFRVDLRGGRVMVDRGGQEADPLVTGDDVVIVLVPFAGFDNRIVLKWSESDAEGSETREQVVVV